MKRTITLIFILFLLSPLAYSQFFTGNDLYQKAISEIGKYANTQQDVLANRMYALGYIIGVFDVGYGLLWNAPPQINTGQVQDVAIKYLREHPERRHEPAFKLLSEAFQEAFPIK